MRFQYAEFDQCLLNKLECFDIDMAVQRQQRRAELIGSPRRSLWPPNTLGNDSDRFIRIFSAEPICPEKAAENFLEGILFRADAVRRGVRDIIDPLRHNLDGVAARP